MNSLLHQSENLEVPTEFVCYRPTVKSLVCIKLEQTAADGFMKPAHWFTSRLNWLPFLDCVLLYNLVISSFPQLMFPTEVVDGFPG